MNYVFMEGHRFETLVYVILVTVDSLLIVVDQEIGFDRIFKSKVVCSMLQGQGVFGALVNGIDIFLSGQPFCAVL